MCSGKYSRYCPQTRIPPQTCTPHLSGAHILHLGRLGLGARLNAGVGDGARRMCDDKDFDVRNCIVVVTTRDGDPGRTGAGDPGRRSKGLFGLLPYCGPAAANTPPGVTPGPSIYI